MKKFNSFLFIAVLVLASCSKEDSRPLPVVTKPTGVVLPSGVVLPRSVEWTHSVFGTNTTTYVYSSDNKLVRENSNNSQSNFIYDGNLIVEKSNSGNPSPSKYSYDNLGRLISWVEYYSQDSKTVYTYLDGTASDGTVQVDEYTTDPATGLSIKQNKTTILTFIKGNLVKSIATTDSVDTKSVTNFTFEYDSSNNMFKNAVGYNKSGFSNSTRGTNNPTKETLVSKSIDKTTGVETNETVVFSYTYVYDATKSYPVEIKRFREKELLFTIKIRY
jgi:hypothetical protein